MRGATWILTFAATAGVAVFVLVSHKSSTGEGQMLTQLAADIDRGGIGDLGRAQAEGRHLMLTNPRDREAAASLAFTNAILAVDYGLDTTRETAESLSRAGGSAEAEDAASVIATAARALHLLAGGDRNLAGRFAAQGAAVNSDLPHPLYALGRARARSGDPAGAARALEAAIIRAPQFSPARAAWAEAQLDLGDAKAAGATLASLAAQAPKDARIALLLEESEAAADAAAPALDSACTVERWLPPALVAACSLARAARARRAGARLEARALAESAASIAPDEPRLLSRTALALAQLGAVDRSAALVERARRLLAPTTPTLTWAAAAVLLGRGRAGALPSGLRPADPEIRLLLARASLAAGGVGALSSTLDELGPHASAKDADIGELSRLRQDAATPVPPIDDPARAFVDGLRARLDGKLEAAAEQLARALSGHGDACRAAGEYRATLRALKQRPAAGVFDPLRAENAACVNLPR